MMKILLQEFYNFKKQYTLRFPLDHGCLISREKKAWKYFSIALKKSLDLTLIYSQGSLLTKMNE